MKQDNVEIGPLFVSMRGVQNSTEIDWGSVTIKCEERWVQLDIVKTLKAAQVTDKVTTFICILSEDGEIFPDCPYDLTKEDLMFKQLHITAYVVGDIDIIEMDLNLQYYDLGKLVSVELEK